MNTRKTGTGPNAPPAEQRSFSPDWRRVSAPFALVGTLLISAAPGFSQTTRIARVLHDLEQRQSFSEISISPDGSWITWSQEQGPTYVLDRTKPSAEPKRIAAGREATGISWSPDSSRLAYLSEAGTSGQQQIFVVPARGRAAKKLTDLHGYVTDVRWAPDGKRIAFLYAENGGGGGPLGAAAEQVGEIGSVIHNQRICLIDAVGGAVHPLSPPDLNVYEYAWSPEGATFAAIAAPGPADNNWWVAKLYTMSAQSGAMHVVYAPKDQQIAIPRWSPDARRIAFIGGLMSDEGFVGGDIYLVDASGGTPRNLTNEKTFSASSVHWLDNGTLLFTAAQEGGSVISRLSLADSGVETIWKDNSDLHAEGNDANLAFSANGEISVAVRSSWQDPPEVWAGPLDHWQQVTHINAGLRPHWGQAESIAWNSGPYRVQGWLLYPENFDPAKRYPMIVSIHGGPAGADSAHWPSSHFDMSAMAALDYFVFFPNPRGSYGQGEAFTRGNVKDFGYGDLRDVLAGMDTVLSKVPVDPDRIGVAGWSYGGYMTMWTVTQTRRFRAAVAGAGIADWQSYYGENLIDKWMIPYFGASVYDDPAVYAKSSPITFIKQVKTPTLVLVGERDAECPSPQSFEFWHALRTLGVPTKLVVYPGEGHRFKKPEDNLDRMRRVAEWFDSYLAAK